MGDVTSDDGPRSLGLAMTAACCRRPDFLGIGVQKGGTTTLHALLDKHPEVMLAKGKEIHYFSLHHQLGEAWYGSHFSTALTNQCCGEITPYYLFHPLSAQRIKDLRPDMRMIVLLRDPVSRTLSQVFHSYRLGFERLEPEAALEAEAERLASAEPVVMRGGRHRSHQEHSYLARSRYEVQLARYEACFPRHQLLLLRSEDLFLQPEQVWAQVQSFLNLDPVPLPTLPRENAGKGEAAGVSPALRQKLRQQLRPTYALMEQRYGLRWSA